MKAVLVFREGQSGNFFKLLVEDPENPTVDFRISDCEKYTNCDITLTHLADYDSHIKNYDLVLRILPTEKIYLACYNNFMKKLIVEQSTLDFKQWKNNILEWYDICYYNLQEYHGLISQDIAENKYVNVVDFDLLNDYEYLEQILDKYFSLPLTESRKKIVKKYHELQLQLDLDCAVSTMSDIAKQIPEIEFANNPWFFSYCLYKFEKANGFTENNRNWSLNQLQGIQNSQDLLNLSKKYC